MILPMLEGTRASPDFNATDGDGTNEVTALSEEEQLRAQYNKAAAVTAALQGLIDGRKARGADYTSLAKVMAKAEKKKAHLRAKLAEYGVAEALTARAERPL
jgi:hypothetical protein